MIATYLKVCKRGHPVTPENTYMSKHKTATGEPREYSGCKVCKNITTQKSKDRNRGFLPKDTKVVMAAYKEPLKPVTDGYGYYGTIAYDESKQYTQCHICGTFHKELAQHTNKYHNISGAEYRVKFGLPTTLSLRGPAARSKNYETWANLSLEEKKEWVDRITKSRRNIGRKRGKSLYQRNLEGRCPDQLLDKIQALADTMGMTPTWTEFRKHYSGYAGSVMLTFGSWNAALELLGMKARPRGSKAYYSKGQLLKQLIDFKIRYGREPMTSDTVRGLLPSQSTYRKHFGTWMAAKELAK